MSSDDITLWVAACRYYIGRQTYAVGSFCEMLRKNWEDIDPQARQIIKREVNEAFERDDASRANGESIQWLGADCDRAEWDRVRKLWT